MPNAYIVKEHTFTPTESLVHLKVTHDNHDDHYVTLVVQNHATPQFQATERVTEKTVHQVFVNRQLFNGRRRDVLSDNNMKTEIVYTQYTFPGHQTTEDSSLLRRR